MYNVCTYTKLGQVGFSNHANTYVSYQNHIKSLAFYFWKKASPTRFYFSSKFRQQTLSHTSTEHLQVDYLLYNILTYILFKNICKYVLYTKKKLNSMHIEIILKLSKLLYGINFTAILFPLRIRMCVESNPTLTQFRIGFSVKSKVLWTFPKGLVKFWLQTLTRRQTQLL